MAPAEELHEESCAGLLRFQYTLRRNAGTKFGLKASVHMSSGVCCVQEVSAGGLVAEKNAKLAGVPELRSHQLLVGDFLMTANGKNDLLEICDELKDSCVLHLAVERVLRPEDVPRAEPSSLADPVPSVAAAPAAVAAGALAPPPMTAPAATATAPAAAAMVPAAAVNAAAATGDAWGAAWRGQQDPWAVDGGTGSTTTGTGSGSNGTDEDQRQSTLSSPGGPSFPSSPPSTDTGNEERSSQTPATASASAATSNAAESAHAGPVPAEAAVLDKGGVFEALQDYNPVGGEPESGYLALQHGTRVQIFPATRQLGEPNNVFREYVFGSLIGESTQGWLPAAVLTVPASS